MISVLILLRSFIVLVFGLAVTLLFAAVKPKRFGKLGITIFFFMLLFIQILSWRTLGLEATKRIYPLITHLPAALFLVFYFKRPWSISIISVLTAYLCCQIPRWVGSTLLALTGSKVSDHIGYLITMCFVYYFLKKYVANSIQELMERSIRSCLAFGAMPLLYYIFDYATTIYTNLLYSGAREAVQFTPSLICTFYLLFVVLYYSENKKQTQAQQERDIFASQLHQSRVELDIMRQMQSNTMIYRHDMRHHLALIGSYAADGDLYKIKEYLAVTESDIDALTPVRYCENETVNLIVSNFAARAKMEQVTLNTNIHLPKELGINDTELCALLSNALENAITATAKVEEEKLRKVHIHAVLSDRRLVISTENAYEGVIEMVGETPKSSNKENGHGFGITSIIAIVERHGGLYSFETEGGIFTLQLLLPLDIST
jgi:hypothetical protein